MAENQLDILEEKLKENLISYKRYDDKETPFVREFHKIEGKDNDGFEWDVICHPGSYGYEEGLLEYDDNITYDVIGDLTADEVIKLINSAQYRKGYADAISMFQVALESTQGGWRECVFGTGD